MQALPLSSTPTPRVFRTEEMSVGIGLNLKDTVVGARIYQVMHFSAVISTVQGLNTG